jgi:proline dehydrogenase
MQPDFSNTARAFAHLSDRELRRALLLFRAVGSPAAVKAGKHLLRLALALRLPVAWALRPTVFSHFCGGETIAESEATVARLARGGVHTILDYSAEGKYAEPDLDAARDEVLAVIRATAGDERHAFAVFKVSALAPAALLEGVGGRDGVEIEDEIEIEIEDEVGVGGEVEDEVGVGDEIEIEDEIENRVGDGVEGEGRGGGGLSAGDQAAWERVEGRVTALCRAAAEAGKRIMIDAEESWIQPAIDRLAEGAMAEFNRERPVVFTTVQLYRHDRLAYLEALGARADAAGFQVGVKLVRGAYMEKERARAAAQGYPDPIQPDKAATDRDYDAALQWCIGRIDRTAVVAGSHNEASNALLCSLMADAGLAPSDPRVAFAQLLGMSDTISFNLAADGFQVAKYVPYGPLLEAIPYLLRRAEENTSVAGQSSRELHLLRLEHRRRSTVR